MKKKLIKRVFSMILTVSMSATFLLGCGNTEKTEETAVTEKQVSEEENGEQVNEATEVAEEVVNINVVRPTYNLANPDADQVKKVEDAVNAYIADKINVHITLTDMGSGEYVDKVNLALANQEINLMWTASWQPTIGTNDLVPAKAVYDLTDLIQGTAVYNSMDEGQWEATKYNGKIYYIPVYKDNVEGYDLMFRQDLVDKYGWDLSTVTGLQDIEPMLADCKEEGLKYPFLTQNTASFFRFYLDKFDFLVQGYSLIGVDRETNTIVNPILTEEYKEFCTMMAQWAEAGYISEDDIVKATPGTTTQTQEWGISWWTDIPVNDEADARYGQDVTMIPFTERWAHSTSALGSVWCVTATSTEKEAKACVDFMGLLYTDSKLADLWTFGIEGEDFTYNENGQVVQTSEKYNHSMWESASATIVTPIENEPANKADLYEDFNGGANTSCAAGFRYDRTPIDAQLAACLNVFELYGYPLENGGFKPDEVESKIEEFQAALDEAGYQEVLAEFSAQYEAWK